MFGHGLLKFGAACIVWAALCFCAFSQNQADRPALAPPFTIWDVELGQPVSQIPEIDVIEISCGTNGGPRSSELDNFEQFGQCTSEGSGLREVHFSHDDEMDYIAKAMSAEFEILQDGTTVFSHPVWLSVLVDEDAIVRGIRILTDPRIPDRERRRSVTLIRNFKAKYDSWNLDCNDIPATRGEEPVGRILIKETCLGTSEDGSLNMRIDARYLRKKGQIAVNPETQEVNSSYFESYTRFELVQVPYSPNTYGAS